VTTTITTLAWHNNPDLKIEVVDRLQQHRAEDSIIKGVYQQLSPELASGYRGCAIGCTLPHLEREPSSWHGRVEDMYGIPRTVARLIDGIFENLPTGDDQHARFAVEVIEAVPVGADLSLVTARLMLDLLADPDHGVRQYTQPDSRQRVAVDAVIGLYRRRLGGEEITAKEWRDAADAAYAAAAAAADAAYAAAYADAAAVDAADAAAAAYADAAAADAAYAAAAAAADAAYAAAYADAAAVDAADAAYAAADDDAAAAYAAAYAAADDDAAAAYAAADAAADADARKTHRTWQAERLIHHLTTTPHGVPHA